MPFTYTLRTPDFDDVGEIELDQPAVVGDEIQSTRSAACSSKPSFRQRIEEFVDSPRVGFLVVEPIDD